MPHVLPLPINYAEVAGENVTGVIEPRRRYRNVKLGGLMRCCIESIRSYEETARINCEGTVVRCTECKDSAIVRTGQWCWNRPEE